MAFIDDFRGAVDTYMAPATNGNLSFNGNAASGGATRMVIHDETGNVGIGTTNPGFQEQRALNLRRCLRLSFCRALMVIGVAAGIAWPLQPAAAQVAGATQVTDPEMLRSMGFAQDADNVYMDDAVGLATISDEDTPDEDAVTPLTTPTTGVDFSAISAKEFIGRLDTTGTQWRYTGGPNCCVDLSRIGTEQFADAQFEVPTGATLDFFRFWAFDNSPSNLAFFVFEVCQPAFAAGPPTIVTIVSTTTSGTPGHTTGLVDFNRLVNNQSCTYLARVRFDAASTADRKSVV